MIERWLPVVGFEGRYEVSDLGRVRSVDRILTFDRVHGVAGTHNTITYPVKGRILQSTPDRDDYPRVTLGCKGPTVKVHHLVLEAFAGPRPDNQESLHANDIKNDNTLDNLSWGTASANQLDAVRNGRSPTGERKKNSKLKYSDIPEIRRRIAAKESCIEIAADFKVSETAIRHIKNGRSWKCVETSS